MAVLLQELAAVFTLPELVNWRLHVIVVAEMSYVQVVTLAWTCAELVNDPNRPNTNPAMAMAAMSVIAMRITVARTGKMSRGYEG